MTDDEWRQLGGYLQRYASESLRSGEAPKEINQSLKEIVLGNYIKGYGYAYALDPKYCNSLPSRWTTKGKSAEEKLYEELNAKYVTNRVVENNFFEQAYKSADYTNGLLANEKTKQDIEQVKKDVTQVLREEHPVIAMVGDGIYAVGSATGKVIYVSREVLLQVAPIILAPEIAGGLKVGQAIQLAAKYPKVAEAIIAGGVSTGFDVYNGEVNYEKTLANFALAGIKAGKSTSQQLSIDAIYNGLTLANDKTKSNEDIGWEGLGKLASTVTSITSDIILMKQGVNPITRQIISNFGSGYTENQVKEIRSSLNNKEQAEESK